ncbi:hypothetical protein Leryth_011750 [Lithospermum erythrorhizon]|nr:hypothetical protein Leryth_011750 [Lithospermum erythrorhizon]
MPKSCPLFPLAKTIHLSSLLTYLLSWFINHNQVLKYRLGQEVTMIQSPANSPTQLEDEVHLIRDKQYFMHDARLTHQKTKQ